MLRQAVWAYAVGFALGGSGGSSSSSSISSSSSGDVANSLSRQRQPHLIFALVDDWGWHMMGFHGNELIATPFIDRLVMHEGAQIERHYAYVMCSPSRRSFLSGRVPPHSGVQNHGSSAIIDLRMRTIADELSSAGYSTGYSGKWHAGHEIMALTPSHRGFDRSLGYFNAMCDHYTQHDHFDGCRPEPGVRCLALDLAIPRILACFVVCSYRRACCCSCCCCCCCCV
jgi:hypothetical protein